MIENVTKRLYSVFQGP